MWRQFGPPRVDGPFTRLPEAARAARLWALSRPEYYAADSNPYLAEELRTLHESGDTRRHALGETPVLVVSAGAKEYPSGLEIRAEELRRLNERNQTDLLGLSHDSERVVAASARHHVHLDSPDVVVGAVRRVVEAVRSGRPLGASEPVAP